MLFFGFLLLDFEEGLPMLLGHGPRKGQADFLQLEVAAQFRS